MCNNSFFLSPLLVCGLPLPSPTWIWTLTLCFNKVIYVPLVWEKWEGFREQNLILKCPCDYKPVKDHIFPTLIGELRTSTGIRTGPDSISNDKEKKWCGHARLVTTCMRFTYGVGAHHYMFLLTTPIQVQCYLLYCMRRLFCLSQKSQPDCAASHMITSN